MPPEKNEMTSDCNVTRRQLFEFNLLYNAISSYFNIKNVDDDL